MIFSIGSNLKRSNGMKVIISEYSSGFSDYSYILCNQLANDENIDDLIYLTDENNFYLSQINKKVKVRKLYQCFSTDKRYKKGQLRWLFNRGFVALQNCVKRNYFVKKEKPDFILIHATIAVLDCHFLYTLKKKTKVILVVHDVIVPTDSISWNMNSLKKMYQNADILIVHSETNKMQLLKTFDVKSENVKVIPHGVKSTYKKLNKEECRNKLGILDSKPVFLFYGGIRKSKGLDILIKALKGVDCILVIAGKPFYGETFENYRKLIDENKIKTVEYIEFTDDDFRDTLFQASDYLVLPYKEFYSQSGVFMQAIQYHLPVIATDVGSFREFIEKYDLGFVAESNDVEGLHKVICEALMTKKEYEKNMEKAVSENSWKIAGRMYADILKV